MATTKMERLPRAAWISRNLVEDFRFGMCEAPQALCDEHRSSYSSRFTWSRRASG